MDKLPTEMCEALGRYLDANDLQNLRLTNKKWNHVARSVLLRTRRLFNVTFDRIETLTKFHSYFVNYEPKQDFCSGKFTFMNPVLTSSRAYLHLSRVMPSFGHLITHLSLNFIKVGAGRGDVRWIFPSRGERSIVPNCVTFILASVKRQLEELHLHCYMELGLEPFILGTEPFPRLSTLKIHNWPQHIGYHCTDDTFRMSMSKEEECLVKLSEMVPAIQNFVFEQSNAAFGSILISSYLPNVIQNLVATNSNVLCSFDLKTAGKVKVVLIPEPRYYRVNFDPPIFKERYEVSLKITEISFPDGTFKPPFSNDCQKFVNWISRTAESMKKLTFPSAFHVSADPEPTNPVLSLYFKDTARFVELHVRIDIPYKIVETLEALVHVSRAHKLQRFQRILITINVPYLQNDDSTEVPQIYVDELNKYHDSVIVRKF